MTEELALTSSHSFWALLAILCVQGVTDLAVLIVGTQEMALSRSLPCLVSGAAGVLLATACLDLLPEAVRLAGSSSSVWQVLLGSLLALFCLEALAHGTADKQASRGPSNEGIAPPTAGDGRAGAPVLHHHPHSIREVSRGAGPLLLGSALHSGVDGLAIAAAFAVGRGPGWSAAVAVGLHELPHRLGDFSLLLHKGLSRRAAAQMAIAAGATAFVGGLVVLAFGHYAQAARWLTPVSAASFLYIALVDLVPEVQSQHKSGRMGWEIACLLGGAGLVAAIIHLPGE